MAQESLHLLSRDVRLRPQRIVQGARDLPEPLRRWPPLSGSRVQLEAQQLSLSKGIGIPGDNNAALPEDGFRLVDPAAFAGVSATTEKLST